MGKLNSSGDRLEYRNNTFGKERARELGCMRVDVWFGRVEYQMREIGKVKARVAAAGAERELIVVERETRAKTAKSRSSGSSGSKTSERRPWLVRANVVGMRERERGRGGKPA